MLYACYDYGTVYPEYAKVYKALLYKYINLLH
jgi:hypothetical protein